MDSWHTIKCPTCSGSGKLPGLAKRLFEEHPLERVVLTDLVIHPSGGNDTYYLGGLDRFPSQYWNRLEGWPSRLAVRDAVSGVCVSHGRRLVGLPPLGEGK